MSDSDAWARACAEDLEAEKARRRATRGEEPGSPAEEFRKLFEAVTDKLSGALGGPLAGPAAGQAAATVKEVVNQAKALVEPVIERNPQVFDHLAAAGNELLAAYRSAVQGQEARWTRGDTRQATGAEPKAGPDTPAKGDGTSDGKPDDGPDEAPGSGQHIDLD
ncbi:DUF5304 domain-containing protein [Streptomyces sp. NPDC051909]|uniref:DUF5304 domain-containing protein n=1 Tax=Streptomyces sp. NPDC051909 TaxID=3154944 RepID=UPI0034396E0A